MHYVTNARVLRARLQDQLRRVIGQPAVEAKELAAFDLLMTRRDFLQQANYAVIAGLVAAGTPPTLWGRRDPKLRVEPHEVGLTAADQASATAATQLTVGTELFEETVYAEPPVSPEAVGSHGVIEGARGQLRLQSDLTSGDPQETAFLDTNHHWGPPELLQLEDTSSGWELVHYHHPWGLRADGATTDGMVRQVIMDSGSGLVSPTQVLTMTGSNSNKVVDGSSQQSGVTYAVVVMDSGAPGGGHLCAGAGAWSMTRPYAARPSYPVHWTSVPLTTFGPPKNAERAEKYVFTGYHNTPTYNAGAASDHVVLYYPGGLAILSLNNGAEPGTAALEFATLDYPSGNADYRVVHIGATFALARTTGSDDSFTIATAEVDTQNGTQGSKKSLLGSAIEWYSLNLTGVAYNTSTTTTTSTVGPIPDFAGVGDVHDLFTGNDSAGFVHHVKLARFGDAVALFVMGGDALVFEGLFPLAFPDAAGIGTPTTLSGGVSKFGGFRFVVSDTDGNVFLMRQRRLTGQDSPYTAAIYAQFDATGAPQPDYNSTDDVDYDDIPSTTASTSNLNNLLAWVQSTVPPTDQKISNISYNLLLNTALAFGTDDTNTSQAVWLGSAFQAAYAPKRFPHDSEHIEIKRQQGSSTQYAAYVAIANPVTRTWHTRQIAAQVLPQPPGLNESGDHYQATIAGANAYGRPVSLALGDNADLLIEVRADAPTLVVDDTHTLYYDIDRYTSFMAAPDPSSGRLGLVVKAETFAQVLYVRLVDTSGLQPSGGDTAMLSSTGVTTYPWQTVNLAAQAQQRMGNDGSTATLDRLGDDAPLVDTTQYISGASLTQSSSDNDWQFKGGYTPSQSNLGSLATYLNTSGQNLIAATPQLGVGASPDAQTINPLTAVTAVPSSGLATGTTTFTYPAGTIAGGPATSSGAPASIWSGISHALHDALHWLQNVEAQVYNDLAEGAVAVEMAADSITATVSADIMEAVNGVDQALTEVVSTVEEYANVVANLVVTIVEQSFLYKLIEEIIALISLFAHLKDIQDLSDSLHSTFSGLGALPTGSSWDTFGSDYIGTDNALTNADAVNGGSTSVPDELVTGLLDAIFDNPLTKKILNKVTAYLSQYLGDLLPEPPIGFDLPTSLADNFIADVATLEQILITDVVDLTQDAMTDLMNMLVADLEDPQATYTNLKETLAGLADEIGADVEQVFDWVDGVIAGAVSDAQQAIGTDSYITVTIPGLADLCRLFGFGKTSGNTVDIDGHGAVFFPMALVVWVAVYMLDGKSISSVADLSATAGAPGAPDASIARWPVARLAVDGAMTELGGGLWSLSKFVDGAANPAAGPFFSAAGAWFNLIRWANDLVYTVENTTPKLPDALYLGVRTYFAVISAVLTLPRAGLNPGAGWPDDPKRTDIVNLINTVLTIAIMGYDTYEVAASDPTTSQIIGVIGQDLARTQPLATTIYDVAMGDEPPNDVTLAWPLYVAIVPAVGWTLQGMVAEGDFSDPSVDRPGNDNPRRQGPPDGRPRRRHRDDPPGRARRRRRNG